MPRLGPSTSCVPLRAGSRSWSGRLSLLALVCGLAMGCGGEDDKITGSAGADDEEECVPADSCCKICVESQPCGDACIASDLECSTEPGCACDVSVVCVEDSGETD